MRVKYKHSVGCMILSVDWPFGLLISPCRKVWILDMKLSFVNGSGCDSMGVSGPTCGIRM